MGGMGEMSMGVGPRWGTAQILRPYVGGSLISTFKCMEYIHACVGVHVEKCVDTSERLIHTLREKDAIYTGCVIIHALGP